MHVLRYLSKILKHVGWERTLMFCPDNFWGLQCGRSYGKLEKRLRILQVSQGRHMYCLLLYLNIHFHRSETDKLFGHYMKEQDY